MHMERSGPEMRTRIILPSEMTPETSVIGVADCLMNMREVWNFLIGKCNSYFFPPISQRKESKGVYGFLMNRRYTAANAITATTAPTATNIIALLPPPLGASLTEMDTVNSFTA